MSRTYATRAGAPNGISRGARGTLDREHMRGQRRGWGLIVVVVASFGCGDNDAVTVDAGAGADAGDASAPPDAHCALPSAPPRLIFLNRGGGLYTKGTDDAATNVSAVLPEGTTIVPVPTISEALWTATVACVAAKFAPFNIRVVDVDPAPAPHREAVFVDRMEDIGFPATTSGIVATRCPSESDLEPLARAITFSALVPFGNSVDDICENAVMSLGFTFNLDRTLHGPDLMSYLPAGSAQYKTFVDMDMMCGDYDPRDCVCTTRTIQNTYQQLLALAGPACE